jgi:hypothetical protein
MPTINVQPRDMQDGTRITYFTDTVGTSSTTYTFNATQETIWLRNKGSKDITYTAGSFTGTLGKSEIVKLTGTFTNVILSSIQGTQAFELISDEVGTVGSSPEAVSALGQQVSAMGSSLAGFVKSVNGTTPDVNGNVIVTTSGGSGGTFDTLSALQTAYPNGNSQPAWVTADNAWYYWTGAITPPSGGGTTPDTTPPSDVTNLTTSNKTKTSIQLNWTISVSSDTSSYDIYDGSTLIGTVSHPNNLYVVSGLAINSTHTFTVKAKDATGNVSTGVSVTDTTLNQSGFYIALDGTAGKVVIPNPAGTRIMTMKLARRNGDTGILFDFRSNNVIYAGNSSTGYNTFEINGVSNALNNANVASLPNDTVVDLKVTLTADAVAGNISIGKHYSAVDYLNMDLYDVKLYDVNMNLLNSFTFSGTGTTLTGTNGNGTITSGTWVAY